MAHEIELAQADALGSAFTKRSAPKHAAPIGTPCANCATPLQGPWCHACGQLGEDFHRSALKLAAESVEGLLHLDGRVWRTLPDLILRPGRLTRAYLEGHRAPQIPPLRLFLVVLLLLFLAGSFTGGLSGKHETVKIDRLTPAQKAELAGVVARAKAGQKLSPAERAKLKAELKPQAPITIETTPDAPRAPQAAATPPSGQMNLHLLDDNGPVSSWIEPRANYAMAHPEEFKLLMEQWSERFAFLMLPLAAALMSLLFVFQRRFLLFDHLVFSMHSLSFLGLLISADMLLQQLWDPLGLIVFAAPVHLFAHMRGVYATSVFGALLRMALLFVGSLVGFSLLMLGLVAVGLAGLHV